MLIAAAGFLLTTSMVKAQAPTRQENSAGSAAVAVDKGKEVFSVACTGCHGANHVTIQRKPLAAWQKTVYTMIGRGAQIMPDEIEPLAAFLTATYGPASPLPVVRGAPAGAPQPLPPGGEIVVRSCSGCHSMNLIFGSRRSLAAWRNTINSMRSNGARISDGDVEALAVYLGQQLGPR
jgi:cytochrome c5